MSHLPLCRRLNSALILAALALLGLCANQPALAQNEDDLAQIFGDKDFVMIATGSRTPLARAPSVTSVITAEDIRAQGATDLDEALETVAGLHVSRAGASWLPIYVIRGIQTQYNPEVLVMINGIPITSGFAGDRSRYWAGFPLENVERIEIIRGPGSALYGAEAVSGVINIITKTSNDIAGTEFGARAGSFQTYDLWAQHGGHWAGYDVSAYLRLGTSEGHDARILADAQTRLDNVFGTNASLAPGAINTGHDAIDLRLDLARDKWRFRTGYKGRPNVQSGTGLADALDPQVRAENRNINADLTWHDANFRQDWDLTAQASYYHIEALESGFSLYPAGSALPRPIAGGSPSSIGMMGRPQHWENQTRLNLSAAYNGFQSHRLRLGAGWFMDDLYKVTESKNFTIVNVPGVGNVPTCVNLACSVVEATEANGLAFMTPHNRHSIHAYAQDEWNLAPDWALTAGVRHDRYSDFGGTTNPRLALVWNTGWNLTSKLMYGRAFRAPSFAELHTTNNPVALGNPVLKPETIDTLELAFAWQPSTHLKTGLDLFRYRMDDVIRFLPNADPTTGNTAQNAGRQHGSGLEMEFTWTPADHLRLSGNYAWQRSIDESTQRDAGLAPHHQFHLRGDWRYAPGWNLNAQLNWVADRARPAGDNRPPVDDYTTLDLTLRTDQLRQNWHLAFAIRNLFDADAREPTTGSSANNIPGDLPLPGRSIYLELRYQ